ncbi:MAG: TetR/AcrR family transcriptional regulator [Treponema sp.]|jgi:AcrR family transcriptional regulator|nr:TetR/AcrR family transcriptional regulator [Treponema sp.]
MTKTEIVEAAFRVWGRNFYQKTSLSQLAEELKVSKPALYRHFEKKQALNAAMNKRFFDDFSAFVRTDFEKALQDPSADEGISTIVQCIADFYARNVYDLLFSLMNIYNRNLDSHAMSEHFNSRGTNIRALEIVIEKKYDIKPVILHLIFATLTFYVSCFHKANDSFSKTPAEEEIKKIKSFIYEIVRGGLGFNAEKIRGLDFVKLENMVEGIMRTDKPEPLLKAIAEAVAETGPWETSMDMVAKRMGISKSSLYGHFKNKKDMLYRLFSSEFERIIDFARQGIKMSSGTAEQLYLGIFSIAVYMRSRPEILIAIDWIRTRKLDLGKPEKKDYISKIFKDIKFEGLPNIDEKTNKHVFHWIIFLITNILTRPFMTTNVKKAQITSDKVQNDDIRVLYKFITLGLGGFTR